MDTKVLIGIIVVALILLGLWSLGSAPSPEERLEATNTETGSAVTPSEVSGGVADPVTTEVADGTYTIVPEQSTIRWSGKKPLIEGYINSGTLGVTAGAIVVIGDSKSGEFTIDMNTLVVSETKAKPGQETSLEGHLKGERWFNVAAFPTATFSIDSVVARPDSATTRLYDVTGTLTMKGTSGELSFPATIYQLENGSVRAQASFEFDRTKWGITAGSSNFFENLADNAVSDMVALSFDLTAVEK